ncbi:hypothetical protein [Halalkalicoccus ordinarius]
MQAAERRPKRDEERYADADQRDPLASVRISCPLDSRATPTAATT